jgi:hypothetical protein
MNCRKKNSLDKFDDRHEPHLQCMFCGNMAKLTGR